MIGSKFTKATAIALSAALISTSVLPVVQAEAGHRNWSNNNYNQHRVVRYRNNNHNQYRVVRHRNNGGDALAAGIIGFALGAIIANEANRPRERVIYRPAYVQPRYVQRRALNNVYDNGPRVIRYENAAAFEPWTPGWARWCDQNYISFDVRNGTYRGYDGLDHFCVVQ